MELQIIRAAEDVVRRPAFYDINQAGAFDEARAENRMREIGPGLVERGYAVELRAMAETQAGKLRKHEPHPVGRLAAGLQFRPHLSHDGLLGADEAVEIEAFRHPDPIS